MKLLVDDLPLFVLPKLACAIGESEAMMLQQIYYWLQVSGKERAGQVWIYNTYEEWHQQFPFWSSSKVRRIISQLEKENLVITGNFNRLKSDQTKWYTINFQQLENLGIQLAQNKQKAYPKGAHVELLKMNKALPEITETNKKIIVVVDYLNQKVNKHFSPSTKVTKRAIQARFNEGFTVEDCKKVIDIKAADWQDTEMSKYLRPETLFGTKFESYLNEGVDSADVMIPIQSVERFNMNEGEEVYEG